MGGQVLGEGKRFTFDEAPQKRKCDLSPSSPKNLDHHRNWGVSPNETANFSTGRESSRLLGRWLRSEFMTSDHVISFDPIGWESLPSELEANKSIHSWLGLTELTWSDYMNSYLKREKQTTAFLACTEVGRSYIHRGITLYQMLLVHMVLLGCCRPQIRYPLTTNSILCMPYYGIFRPKLHYIMSWRYCLIFLSHII